MPCSSVCCVCVRHLHLLSQPHTLPPQLLHGPFGPLALGAHRLDARGPASTGAPSPDTSPHVCE
jgi:hypothetical protein